MGQWKREGKARRWVTLVTILSLLLRKPSPSETLGPPDSHYRAAPAIPQHVTLKVSCTVGGIRLQYGDGSWVQGR